MRLKFQILTGDVPSSPISIQSVLSIGTGRYEVFCELYVCRSIFCSPVFGRFLLREPLVQHRYKRYLRVGDHQPKPLLSVHFTKKISYGIHLRTRTWLVNFLTSIFRFYAKFYAMSKKNPQNQLRNDDFMMLQSCTHIDSLLGTFSVITSGYRVLRVTTIISFVLFRCAENPS